MLERKKAIILDDSETFRNDVSRELYDAGFMVSLATDDPDEAWEKFAESKVDILIMDILLAKTEGIDFIRRVKEEYTTIILVCSYIRTEAAISTVLNLADYYLFKPIPTFKVIDMASMLCGIDYPDEPLDPEDTLNRLEKEITLMLSDLAIPAKLKGYHYIRQALMCVLQEPESEFAITKTIYPAVAKKFKTTHSRTERSIRHAVEFAWINAPIRNIENIFGTMTRKRPTNTIFLATIADRLRMTNPHYRSLSTLNNKK